MAISGEQLESWSHQGSIAQSSNTYNTIKNVLKIAIPQYDVTDFEVFLQGSYGNNTNIYAESDVDIIVKINDCFYYELEKLSEDEKAAYHASFTTPYSGIDFKNIVQEILTEKYGNYLSLGPKAITILANGNLRKADVIVAYQFRNYSKFRSNEDQSYVEGICFHNSDNRRVVNYPKQHSENLTKKHKSTNEWFKPTVRIFKNLHKRLIDTKMLEKGVASSYYLEGMLYNVPSEYFKNSYHDCVVEALNWVQKADRSKFVCVNEQYCLLQETSLISWREDKCKKFLTAAINFWNEQ